MRRFYLNREVDHTGISGKDTKVTWYAEDEHEDR